MARCSIAALLLLAFATSAAARQLSEPAVHAGKWAVRPLSSVVEALQDWSGDRIVVGAADVQEPKQEDRFYLLVKYIVRPNIAKEFSKAWLKVRDEAKKQKGSIRFNLSKTLTDNLVFYSYEEWEGKEDFVAYLKEGSETRKLAKYIEEENIPLVLTQLVPAVPYEKPHSHSSQRATITKKASLLGGQPMGVAAELLGDVTDSVEGWLEPVAAKAAHGLARSSHNAYILIKYVVKPSEACDFIKAVARVTKAVEKEEKASLVYGLSKTLTDDVTYYSYAVWEDEEAVKEHLHKEYTRELQHFILEHDVYASTTVLFPVESLEAE